VRTFPASLLKPLALFVILYLVFVKAIGTGGGVPHFGVYLLVGVLLWNYFGEVTNNGVGAIVGKGDLLRKLNFPKYVIVLAGSFSALINLAITSVVLVFFMIFNHVDFGESLLWAPVIILHAFTLTLMIAFKIL